MYLVNVIVSSIDRLSIPEGHGSSETRGIPGGISRIVSGKPDLVIG